MQQDPPPIKLNSVGLSVKIAGGRRLFSWENSMSVEKGDNMLRVCQQHLLRQVDASDNTESEEKKQGGGGGGDPKFDYEEFREMMSWNSPLTLTQHFCNPYILVWKISQ